MPFDVFFVFVNDQRGVLLEQSKLRGVGDADLFCARLLGPAAGAVE